MLTNGVWTCTNNSEHTFETDVAEKNGYFCTICTSGDGILFQKSNIDDNVLGDCSLCIIFLDCSHSMSQPAFVNSPLTKREILARGVASGIFSRVGSTCSERAYLYVAGFSDHVEVFVPFIRFSDLFRQYSSLVDFEAFLLKKLNTKPSPCDIKLALSSAFKITLDFINLEAVGLGTYKPRYETIFSSNLDTYLIPNVRAILFTDGLNKWENHDNTPILNPFKAIFYNKKNIDLLTIVLIREANESITKPITNLVSKCIRHDQNEQLFLIDAPSKINYIKYLFYYFKFGGSASAFGFCPTCLFECGHNMLQNNKYYTK